MTEYQEATFSGKMKLTNLETDQSLILNLDLFAKKPALLRMEITTSVGFHVASLILEQDTFHLIIPSKKIYRFGTSHTYVFADVIPLPIDPKWIIPIFFEEPLPSWTCQWDEGGYLQACQFEAFKVTWTKRKGYQKTLSIFSDQFEGLIYIKNFKPYLPSNAKLFNLPKISWE